MSWTDDTNDNTEQEENLIALGLMDVENELKKNNKLVLDLKREQREQYKTTNNELQERIALEMQNLKNQKERDMEDLAYKIAQQLQNNSNEIYKNYIDSSKSTFESLRVKIQGEINRNTAELTILSDKNAQYERAVAALEYNKQNQDKKELIFNVAMAVGLVLVSISVLIFAFLFSAAPTHPDPRRRHGHHSACPRSRWRVRLEGQQRPALADPARDHPRRARCLPGGRRRSGRDQHVQFHQ